MQYNLYLLLQHLTETHTQQKSSYWLHLLSKQLRQTIDEHLWQSCWEEVQGVIKAVENADIFTALKYVQALNEVPIIYYQGSTLVHGIIDRLVITEDYAIIIDYKSHQHASSNNLASLAESYREQLQYYIDGIKQLWPEKIIRAELLFTACNQRWTFQQ